MPALAHRQHRITFPDLPEWFETLPPHFAWPQLAALYDMKIEEYTKDDRYVIRAEIPGIEPDRDLDVTVEEGVLTIKAERTERDVDKHRCEIRYGSLSRSVALPKSAKEDDVRAQYTDGMLTVSVGLGQEKPSAKHVEVAHD
jgi:HSP20 family molecular chaperone IbpA